MPKPVDIPGVEILAPITESHAGILSPEAIDFIVDLQRTFNVRRKELLNAREERQRRLDAGERARVSGRNALHSRVRMDGGACARRSSSTAAWRLPGRWIAR